MIITFPHMGDMGIVLKSLFSNLGREVIMPPPISKKTFELGAKYSPETVCLPFKLTLGNFIEALEQGADTLATCGGVGPCRLGYYAEVQRGILQSLGYKFDMIVIEPDITDIFANLRRVTYKRSLWEVYLAFRLAIEKMNALDNIERKVSVIRPLEVNSGQSAAIRKETISAIDSVEKIADLHAVYFKAERELDNIKTRSDMDPLRIGVVGEIYVMLEPFINQNLDLRLGSMGVEIHKTMYLSDYVNGHLFRKSEYLEKFKYLAGLAQPYLGHYVGGHAIKSIAHTVDMGQENYDGIIHMFPFTCMPEVVAKNILPKVSNEKNIPVLSIAFDEQSGDAGTATRLEAFIDLLKYRRHKKAR
ncbi:acyl-CoA dehydratase activase-related protein [Dendrosporobacter sp. 1207_IL3150]|uniref:acyl-CoA dehydratase activase-related protein n=1 Tax=Dendrosporobacter sp. 1207_IL3150 TaxID=3084054 RepID=UPI002FDAEDB6